jgi:hypothetical protein
VADERPASPEGASGSQPPKKPRDAWERLELVVKLIAGISIPLFGVLVTLLLGRESETNRQAQFYASIMTEREKADSEIRAKMFDFLLTRYFGSAQNSPQSLEDFENRIIFLDLLLENFQEHFSSRAIFAHLRRQINDREAKEKTESGKKAWQGLNEKLFSMRTNVAAGQIRSLALLGLTRRDVYVPLTKQIDPTAPQFVASGSDRVPLYSTHGLTGLEGVLDTREASGLQESEKGDVARYSIRLAVNRIDEDSATTTVAIYEDKYVGNKFDPASSKPVEVVEFDASYFSTPYIDNTRLSNRSRFSLIYKGCMDAQDPEYKCRFPLAADRQPQAIFDVVVFKEEVLSQKDRPYLDQVLEKIAKVRKWGWF